MSLSFDVLLPINQIRNGQRVDLVAGDADRRQTAERLGLASLDRLEAHAMLDRDGETVRARGRLRAELSQQCVVTGDPVAGSADEPFDILFLPQPKDARPDEEIELSEADCDIVFHDGSSIALGDAIADTLGLSLDPYPRSASAEAALKEAGVLSEAEAGPFAALVQLKRRDSQKS